MIIFGLRRGVINSPSLVPNERGPGLFSAPQPRDRGHIYNGSATIRESKYGPPTRNLVEVLQSGHAAAKLSLSRSLAPPHHNQPFSPLGPNRSAPILIASAPLAASTSPSTRPWSRRHRTKVPNTTNSPVRPPLSQRPAQLKAA